MIILITTMEHNPKTGKKELITSHGVNPDTGKTVILPCESPKSLGAVFSAEYGEWVIYDKPGQAA